MPKIQLQTIPEKGHMAPRATPCFPGDPIYTEGCRAWAENKGEQDCPYVFDTSKLCSGHAYWETDAGKRERWLAGFHHSGDLAKRTGTLEMVRQILGR